MVDILVTRPRYTGWLSKERSRREGVAALTFSAHCPINVAKILNWCSQTQIIVLVMPQQYSTRKLRIYTDSLQLIKAVILMFAFLLLFRLG